MPFQSMKQMRFMFSQHPDIAKRWAAMTPNIKALPEYKERASHQRLVQSLTRRK